MENLNKKLYIITVNFNLAQQRLFFEGEDTPETNKQFMQATKDLEDVGDACQEWKGFISKAIALLRAMVLYK